MKLFRIAVCVFVLQAPVFAQPLFKNVSTATTVVGSSAISLHTLVAHSYRFNYPFYQYTTDSLSNMFLFSLRQKSDDGKNYLSKAFVGAIDCTKDSMSWYSESNTFDLELDKSSVLFSSDAKTMKVNKQQGFEEFKYSSRLLHPFKSNNKGLMYLPAGSEVVSCINLSDGSVNWTATISGKENWVDKKTLNDSILVIAASGLSAVSAGKGLLWTYPLITSERISSALTVSLADDNKLIKGLSQVIKTSDNENNVTELSSNILADGDGTVYFASKEKIIAVNAEGKLLWEQDLKTYPVSKMYLSKNGSSISLVNFGIAKYADTYAIYGKSFVMSLDAGTGKINFYGDMSAIDNLVDFKETEKSFLFAGKGMIMEARKNSNEVEVLLTLDVPKYGSFSEFIDGSVYHTEKEGFYVSLNFINDNPVYFKADNNKIYGAVKSTVNYEYHFNEIFERTGTFENKIFLKGENKSMIISKNMELLSTINESFQGIFCGRKLLLVGERQVHLLDINDIR